ncbi:unnamed protein product [Schistosoma margrebowiei]|uniref:Uncharacterized protein n=1 Tax=Schistosoma margrebowiei TaxID=48269 RepID=A0A183MR49_9TREM|nr:unnamed protein product [Schistosoma margrebowiei]
MDNWRNSITKVQYNSFRDTNKLNQFKITHNKRFQALQDLLKEEETNMEENWKGMKEAQTSTCQEVLDLNKHHHKGWISMESANKIQERKNRRQQLTTKQNGKSEDTS